MEDLCHSSQEPARGQKRAKDNSIRRKESKACSANNSKPKTIREHDKVE